MKKELAEYTKEEIDLAKHCIDLKTRRAHPDGRFDNAKRWHPDIHTESSRRIREPSRAFPFSLMSHCRTVLYQAQLASLEPKRIRKIIKILELES